MQQNNCKESPNLQYGITSYVTMQTPTTNQSSFLGAYFISYNGETYLVKDIVLSTFDNLRVMRNSCNVKLKNNGNFLRGGEILRYSFIPLI